MSFLMSGDFNVLLTGIINESQYANFVDKGRGE